MDNLPSHYDFGTIVLFYVFQALPVIITFGIIGYFGWMIYSAIAKRLRKPKPAAFSYQQNDLMYAHDRCLTSFKKGLKGDRKEAKSRKLKAKR